jgi:hypothetical protein
MLKDKHYAMTGRSLTLPENIAACTDTHCHIVTSVLNNFCSIQRRFLGLSLLSLGVLSTWSRRNNKHRPWLRKALAIKLDSNLIATMAA